MFFNLLAEVSPAGVDESALSLRIYLILKCNKIQYSPLGWKKTWKKYVNKIFIFGCSCRRNANVVSCINDDDVVSISHKNVTGSKIQ